MKWFDAHPEVGLLVRAGKFARKIFRRRRQRKRAQQQELPFKKEPRKVKKVLDAIAQYRTSTKSGAAGLVPFVALIPFYDDVNNYMLQACQSEQGPTMFLVGGGVLWLTMFVSARLSKTPDKPGAL